MAAQNAGDAGLEAGPLPKKDIEVADDAESSANGEGGVVADTARVQDHEAEVRLCRKFDLRLLPVLAVMCKYCTARCLAEMGGIGTPTDTSLDLFNALDKGNLGNAKTAGLTDDLGFKSNQYNIIVSIFFVPYVLCAPPFSMLGKKYGPHRALPVMMVSLSWS